LARKIKTEGTAAHQIAAVAGIPPFFAHVVSQMIGFFPALWMLIMWDFVGINVALRPRPQRPAESSFIDVGSWCGRPNCAETQVCEKQSEVAPPGPPLEDF
jgi:hypothetical protein